MNILQQNLTKKYRENLQKFKIEIEEGSPGWIKEKRREYLLGEMIKCLFLITPVRRWYEDATERNVDWLVKKYITIFSDYEYWKKRLHKFAMEYKFTMLRERKKGGITPDMIERARGYPIKDIIEVKKNNFALCPFHEDKKHPNFYVKNNWGHCFACGWSGDCIKLVMERDKIGFVEAIKRLI